jgi:hypothetical protein
MMLAIKEWLWEKPSKRDRKEETFCCPYCNVTVRTTADTRIFDAELGAIQYHIFKCPQCCMPVTIGQDGSIIPPSMFLPFDDIQHLPENIEKMYIECRRSFSNECYYAVIMVARSLVMHIAVDKGAETNLRFVQYIDYLETEGFTSRHNRTWVDKIRERGNHYVHEIDEATKDEAALIIVFISHLLKNVYELPQLAMEV